MTLLDHYGSVGVDSLCKAEMPLNQAVMTELNYGPFISRKQAQAKGLTHYFTGIPCRNGHISVRGVKKWNCLQCDRNQKAAERVRDPERVRANERRTASKHREKKVGYVRDWRERNPEYSAIKGKERWDAIKADPALHDAHNEKMRNYWMKRRRVEGVLTWDEYMSKRLVNAVETANAIGKVRIVEILGLDEGKRECVAECQTCGIRATANLGQLSSGAGIRCNCKKSGEVGKESLLKLISSQKTDQTSVYLTSTVDPKLQKFGITNNVSQRFSSHRHSGLTNASAPTWQTTFDCRWKALLWEDAIAYKYSHLADKSLSPVPGYSEVIEIEMSELQAVASLIALEVSALTETTWQAWAFKATPRLIAA